MEYLRINFNQMFVLGDEGSIEPKVKVKIGGIEFGPGVKFNRGVQLSGADIFGLVGKDLAVTQDGEAWLIHGYYE